MSGGEARPRSPGLAPDAAAGRLGAVYDGLIAGLGVLTGILIGIGTLLIALDVVLRNIWVTGIPWLIDAVEYGLFVTTFLAAPWVLRLGAHVRVDIVVTTLPPRIAAALDAIANAIGLAATLILLYYGLRATLQAHAHGSLVIRTLVFPEWWALIVVPFSSILMSFEFVSRLLGRRRPEEKAEF